MESVEFILEMMEIGNSLHAAVFDGDINLARNLLENGKINLNEQDKYGRTLLHYAACRGQNDMVGLLLGKGANPNIKDKNGNTPLHWCGHIDVVELLILRGSKVDERNILGATPIEMARRRGVSKAVLEVFHQFENKGSESTITKTLFHEFSDEMGIKNIILLILILLFVSVYIAYTITGFSSHLHRAQPIVL